MNWKINYWTLLFALTIGMLLYSKFDESMVERKGMYQSAVNCISVDTLPEKIARERIRKYEKYGRPTKMTELDTTVNKGRNLKVVNTDVLYFEFSVEELESMACYWKNKKTIYAYLSLEKKQGSSDYLIDLIFSDILVDDKGGVTIKKEDNPTFFDFTTPCPPC